jgi:transposase
MRLVELRFERPIGELLRELRAEGLSVGQIALRVDVPYGTVHRWLREFRLDAASLVRQALAAEGQSSLDGGEESDG